MRAALEDVQDDLVSGAEELEAVKVGPCKLKPLLKACDFSALN